MNKDKYEKRYRNISDWFRKSETRLKLFEIFYKMLPIIVFLVYGVIILLEVINGSVSETIRVVATPFVTFALCTIVRKGINEKRPYEVMNINPLIIKSKKGQSFPSRHVVSAAVIAMAALYVNITLGIVMLMISIMISIIRPIAGVHYVRDVLGGLVWGIAGGIIGFYII